MFIYIAHIVIVLICFQLSKPDREESFRPGLDILRCLGRPFAGAVAPGAGAGGAEGFDAIPVFGAADQAGVGAA